MNCGVHISAGTPGRVLQVLHLGVHASERVMRSDYEHVSHVHNNTNASVQNS
jgi:hypothetical protein